MHQKCWSLHPLRGEDGNQGYLQLFVFLLLIYCLCECDAANRTSLGSCVCISLKVGVILDFHEYTGNYVKDSTECKIFLFSFVFYFLKSNPTDQEFWSSVHI